MKKAERHIGDSRTALSSLCRYEISYAHGILNIDTRDGINVAYLWHCLYVISRYAVATVTEGFKTYQSE